MKRIVVVVAICVVAVAAIVWLSSIRGGIADGSSTGEWGLAPTPTPGTGIPPRPDEAFALTVTYVYDGDTIQARVQHPNDIVPTSEPVRVRLIGIDTPEGTPSPECWADEARAHLVKLLPEGATVWAAPDRETRDRYGRLLLNLWTDDGIFVNHELVAAGDAEAIAIRPNVAYFDLLSAAQAGAEASGVGRWGACG